MLAARLRGEPRRIIKMNTKMTLAKNATASGAAGLALLTAGCVVGPDFVPPEAPVAGHWAEGGGGGVSVKRGDLVAWWKVFDDPVLDRLVAQASEQNLSLQLAGLRVMEARAQLGIAVGSQYPQVQVATGDLSYNRNPALAKPGFAAASIGFDASWELDLWGKYRRGIESANANLLANVADYNDVVVSITAEVAQTYVTIRSLEARIDTAEENIVTQTRSTEITKALWDEGEKSELDYQQAATTLYETQSTVPGFEIALKQAQHSLAILLGLPPQQMSGLLAGASAIPAAPATIMVGIPSDLLRRRPDLRQAEMQAAAQCAQIGVAKADLYPRLSLLGSIGWNATNSGSRSLGDLFNSTTFGGDIGPSATWNVLNYGRIRNNVRVQDAVFQQAMTNYQQLVLNAAGEVEDAIVGFQRSRTQAALLNKAVAASQRALDLAQLQYKEGQADFQRVLDSTRTLSQQQDQYIQTVGNISTNVVALYKALGGGWQIGGVADYVPVNVRDEMEERTNWGRLLDDPHRSPTPASAAVKKKIKGKPGGLP